MHLSYTRGQKCLIKEALVNESEYVAYKLIFILVKKQSSYPIYSFILQQCPAHPYVFVVYVSIFNSSECRSVYSTYPLQLLVVETIFMKPGMQKFKQLCIKLYSTCTLSDNRYIYKVKCIYLNHFFFKYK